MICWTIVLSQAGQEVCLFAQLDGLHGGDNLVDLRR